jgi:outer membrane protein assembly factor BamB
MNRKSLVALLFTLSSAGGLPAADWPQYRGLKGDGCSPETINVNWPAEGPKVLWKTPTANGFSSFSVSGGKAFTQVNRELDGGAKEICVALDAATGKELWFSIIGPGQYQGGGDEGAKDNNGGDGPRSTPTISDGKVYVFNQHLALSCLDAATGKSEWTVDITKDHAGRNIGWRSAASPVVDGNLVFVAGGGPGESMLAVDKQTGRIVWKTGDEKITHATPVAANILGAKQVVFFMQSGLVSVAAADGKELWRFPFRYNVSSAISPVISGNIVYCSAGYGVGGGACKIAKDGDKFTATELYKVPGDNKIANHWSTPVCKDGYLYGMFSFKKYSTGPFKCVEIATGKIVWEQPGFGPGNAILAGDKVAALTDDGRVVIIDPSPSGYKELAKAKVINGKCWTTPALSDGRLYIRSTVEGACVDLSAK